jgi:predicted nucleic-acid-binding protein
VNGLDTNVLVSWLLAGPAEDEANDGPFFISTVVLAELVWVMRTTFGNSRDRISQTIEAILDHPGFRFADRRSVLTALNDFRTGTADFSDYLIMRDCLSNGCQKVLTNDKKAAHHPSFTLAT